MPEREIWAVDCETDPFKAGRVPKPFIWGLYNGSEYHEFADTADVVAFLAERDCVAYAHNGGRFDWHYLIPFIEPFTECMVIAGRLAKFDIGLCEFRDSFNIMPMPLKAGGKKFEVDDWSLFEREKRDTPAARSVIKERLRTDCVYLWHLLETFFMEFGFHLTISSASMACWSRIAGVEKPKTDKNFYETIAPYYFGGRVESFSAGEVPEKFKIIDINGAYQYAMTFVHPYGESIIERADLPVSRSAIERCFISIRARSLGAFPYRDDDGSLTFPDDGAERDFHISGWEYLAALDTGFYRDGRISSVLQLPETIEFGSYMRHFITMKDKARAADDTPRYEFAKRFQCSLYGKFGSNPDEYSEYCLVPPRHIEQACEADGYSFCAELGQYALLARPLLEAKQRYYNVAVAASVTGFVRAMDWRALCDVRNAGGVVHYIDTDCLHATDSAGLELDDARLGAWKVEAECDVVTDPRSPFFGLAGAYAGKKLYACHVSDSWRASHPKAKEWKTASKGVRLEYDDIIKIARGEEVIYNPEVPQYSLKRGIHFVPRTVRKTAKARNRPGAFANADHEQETCQES